jgi:hypothetical protein
MPLYNFDSLEKILKVVYLEGTILEIDPITETAKVRFDNFTEAANGNTTPIERELIPFYYHCYDNAELHDRGGLKDGYIPFKKDDKVIVACSLSDPTDFSSLQPIHIIAFASGRKPCFFVYFVELRHLFKGWALVEEKTGGRYKFTEDNKPEYYPFVVVKPISLDPLEISMSETSYPQVVGRFNSRDDPFCRWKLYYLPDDLPISALVKSKDGFPLGKLQDFGQAVFSITHSFKTYSNFSLQYLNFSFGEGDLGKIFGVFSQLGCGYVDKVPAYRGPYFGACGFNLTAESQPKGAFFLTSSKVLGSDPASQQFDAAGSRWSKKPMSISSERLPSGLYKHTALAEGGNSVIYTDSDKPPCDHTQYIPFAALGKDKSIYTKRTFSDYPVVKDGRCISAESSPGTLFVALTIPATSRCGTGSGWVIVKAESIFRYFYRHRYNLSEEIYIGNTRVAQSQSVGPNRLSYEYIHCYLNWFLECGLNWAIYGGCGGIHIPNGPVSVRKIFSGASETAVYKDEYVSPLYYDGFLLGDKPYVILFYSKHSVDTTESMPTNDYRVGFWGYAGLFIEMMSGASLYKQVTKIESVHTYEFYIVCMFDGVVTLHEQIGKIQGTYTTTRIYEFARRNDVEYKFTPSHGTIPTCVSCQISKHGAVYTYLEYSGKYPEGLDSGASIYLTGQNRVIGIVSPTQGHKVYRGEDATKILQNMVKSEYEHEGQTETFEKDFSINPKRNIAIGMFPCLRWESK